MTEDLAVGKRYRIGLKGSANCFLEGVLRSTALPPGVLGNRDGQHSIWIAGQEFEWFLRPGEIASVEEVDQPRARLISRRMRSGNLYGRCAGSARRASSVDPSELDTAPNLGAWHRREA